MDPSSQSADFFLFVFCVCVSCIHGNISTQFQSQIVRMMQSYLSSVISIVVVTAGNFQQSTCLITTSLKTQKNRFAWTRSLTHESAAPVYEADSRPNQIASNRQRIASYLQQLVSNPQQLAFDSILAQPIHIGHGIVHHPRSRRAMSAGGIAKGGSP